jgi:hypothetical protein
VARRSLHQHRKTALVEGRDVREEYVERLWAGWGSVLLHVLGIIYTVLCCFVETKRRRNPLESLE